MSISIGRLTTMSFQRFWVLLLRRLEVVFFVFFRIVRLSRGVGCDKRHLLNPPSFLEHHKTLNSKKDIQMCQFPPYICLRLFRHREHIKGIAPPSSPSSQYRPIIIMVRDVDNHGHKIWRPFSALDASNNAATTLALDGSTTATDRLMLSNARQIEFVLHKNIVNSVRFLAFAFSRCWRFKCWFWTKQFFPLVGGLLVLLHLGILPKRSGADGRHRRLNR